MSSNDKHSQKPPHDSASERALERLSVRLQANAETIAYDPALQLFASALIPIAPSALLRQRVLDLAIPRVEHVVLAEEGKFVSLLKGVAVKRLRRDLDSETSIWRLAPGASIPAHGHRSDEECLVLEGSIEHEGMVLGVGDFVFAATGAQQGVISSRTGALLLIRGERVPLAE